MHSETKDPATTSALRLRQDDKFYCKLLSKESSAANPSFHIYYGGASGAVPFRWESQPGTPKHPGLDRTVPPLTPPPSYQLGSRRGARGARKRSSKSGLLRTILPRLVLPRKGDAGVPSSPRGSLSCSSVSSSASSVSQTNFQGRCRRRLSSPRSPFSSPGDEGEEEEEESDAESPRSTLCFGPGRGGFRGYCRRMVAMKNALLSVVGRGSSSSHGTA